MSVDPTVIMANSEDSVVLSIPEIVQVQYYILSKFFFSNGILFLRNCLK